MNHSNHFNGRFVGGATNFSELSLSLYKLDYKKYEITKLNIWLHMLEKGMRPTRWSMPMSSSTKVTYRQFKSKEEFDEGLEELKEYMNNLNHTQQWHLKFLDS